MTGSLQLTEGTDVPGTPLAKEASERREDSAQTHGRATRAQHPAASGVKPSARVGFADPQRRLAREVGELEAMSAEELLRWAYEEFGDKLCLTCSWQKQSSALVHMVSELALDIDVIELDTHLFFRESYDTRERLVERYGLKLIRPDIITVAEQHKREGPNLWERDPDRCCHIRKVEPLIAALEPYDAWISGIRRDQSPSRAGTPRAQWSDRYGVWKIHPLADWDENRVWAYIHVNEIPYNPLHEGGYRSIGCIPCTRPTRPDEEERAGRWAGSDKLECGIHSDTQDGNGRV